MSREEGPRRAGRYLGRALLLRCPVCGKSPIFTPLLGTRCPRDWFTPLDGCPRCGYPYEREAGYFLVSVWIINYGAGSVLGILIYLLMELFVPLSLGQLILAVVVPIFFFNILFARHAKALFIALDHYWDPHEKDPGEDGGNLPRPMVPPRDAGSPAKPVPSSDRPAGGGRKPEPAIP
jgi:uncharacterized protein (DUF983 family)